MDRLKQCIVNLDAADKPRETRTLSGHGGRVTSLAFRADGRILLSGSIDGTVREWDTLTGQELRKINAHSSGVNAVAYTSNSTTILSGSYDHTLKSWSTDEGRYLTKFRGNQSQVLGGRGQRRWRDGRLGFGGRIHPSVGPCRWKPDSQD
jgi:WD40 repeat protein